MLQDYGVDWDGPLTREETGNRVVVPRTTCPLTVEDQQDLATINVLENSENFGIDVYHKVKDLVSNRIERTVQSLEFDIE